MNYSGNMPDWHQYNSPQPIGSEVSSVGQNVNHSPIFRPSISPRRLNGPSFSTEGLNKPQNDANFNPRNFQQSPNTINGPNVPPENSAMASAAQVPGCHGHYGTPSPRNTMIETTNASLDSRIPRNDALNDAMGQRNHQISMNGPTGHLNCPTINGSMGIMEQRNTPTGIQGPIPAGIRQAPGSYVACKGPCCNSDTNLSYQSWDKFGPYPPNVPYRETGYPVDNRRFGSEFENRESLGTGTYNIDPRRNFPEYKYRKDSIIPRGYPHTSGVIQNYPVQNYNFPGDYQKYSGYPVKEYTRDSSITNSQNPAILKYQEQSVIVQQKYFTKQIQYQNGIIPKNIVSANVGGNIISRARNPYFNPQLARDIPRDYSESTSLANRGIQSANSIHTNYPKYQMYQQKIATQRFSMENHLREMGRIPGYQTHPKYQECILRYKELLRLQQTVDYQSTVQNAPRVITSQVNDEIPSINLQFDQTGTLINSNFAPAGFTLLQNSNNAQDSKNVGSTHNREIEPQNLQHPNQYKTQPSFDSPMQNRASSSLSQGGLSRGNEEQYLMAKESNRAEYHAQKSQSDCLHVSNSEDGQTSSLDHKNSRDFADKPELDVRQFLANWDESEDEDGANTNLPDVASNSSTSVVVEYGSAKSVSNSIGESENCSETQEWQGTDDCRTLENTQNEMKSSTSMEDQIHEYSSPADKERPKSLEQDLDISDSVKTTVRIGTVIRSTGADCENETSFRIMKNSEDCRDIQSDVKLSCQETETSSFEESPKTSPIMEVDTAVKQESLTQEETITSIKEHIEAYKYEAEVAIPSSIEETKHDDNSRSSVEKDSHENTKGHYSSSEDFSESSDTDSTDSDTISTLIQPQKTIKGTEIHVDAHELSISPKSNSEIMDSPDLQKQNSFASEESHNPDDISLPDLPTSECTPISTTLNTPIHSDSEESSEPVIDLTIPTNPIEIIQNSPMLSFMHSPIKIEPYEHFDENDLKETASHDDLEFKFQTSNSSENDFEEPIDVCSHKIEHCDDRQKNESTFDSDSIEILSENEEENIKNDKRRVHTKDVLTSSMSENEESAIRDRFTFKKESIVATGDATNTIDTNQLAGQSVTTGKHKNQISDIGTYQDDKNVMDKLEDFSDMERRLSMTSGDNEDHSEDELVCISNTKRSHGSSQWQLQSIKCEIEDTKGESTDSLTALNLVKDESKINSNSIKITYETTNFQAVRQKTPCSPSRFTDQMDFQHSNQGDCDSSMDSQGVYTSSEPTELYSSSSEEDQIYSKSTESRSNFSSSLNFPLIPGEDFEEPKMPVLPMEGNCLTKIIKNTSPIIDLDVLGSDDDKLDKMDDIWMEVSGVDTVGKVADVNMDGLPESSEFSNREKNVGSKNNPCKSQKSEWKHVKNLIKVKDENQLIMKSSDDCIDRTISAHRTNSQPNTSSDSGKAAQKEVETIDENIPGAVISSQVTITPKITSNRSFREGSNPHLDICSETSATVLMKCQEKVNHINDIATKLLENARLFEPELKKMEVLRSETNCNDNSRDGSKNRIKLLKEFRKVKNKTSLVEPTINPTNSVVEIETNIASPIETTEVSTKIDETFEVDDKITKNEITDMGTIEKVPEKSQSSTEEVNVDVENNRHYTHFADIVVSEEKHGRISKNSEKSSENGDTSSERPCIVNDADSVAVKDSNSGTSYETFKKEVVNTFEKDITDCAIDLSKSLNRLDSLQTLQDAYQINYNPNSCKRDDINNTEETIEIVDKPDQERNSTETKNHCAHSSQFPVTKDMGLCSQLKIEKVDVLEVKNAEEHVKSVESNYADNSNSTCRNSIENCITDEEISYKEENQQLTTITGYNKSGAFSRNSEENKDPIEPDPDAGEITAVIQDNGENVTGIVEIDANEINKHSSKPSGHIEVNDLVDIDDEKDESTVDKIINPEISYSPKNVQTNIVHAAIINEEKSDGLVKNRNDGSKKDLFNAPGGEISIQSPDDAWVPPINNDSEEANVVSSKISIDQTPLCDEFENFNESISTKEIKETDGMIDHNSVMNYSKSIEDLDGTSDVQKAVELSHADPKNSAKSSTYNKSPIHTPLKVFTELECLENSHLNDIHLPSGTDESSKMIDTRSEPFELHNSLNCDFNNFDVAPNINSTGDHDGSSSWRYAKACARFEDCERFKNPDSFISPISTSLESLDNLNTVPIYTTKDGKITYSPNPKFTYRALIIEAREREGYPVMRESYYGNNRTQESSHYSKNPSTLRKRKNSEGYRYSRSYTKKNYEPKEHGESSTKNVNEPWQRSGSNHNKYRYQTRVRDSHHSSHRNTDTRKKNTAVTMSNKYTYKKAAPIYNEYEKTRNGASNNYRCTDTVPYRQSKEQPTLDSTWSRHKQDSKCDHQNTSKIYSSRPDLDETFDVLENNNLENAITAEAFLANLKTTVQSMDHLSTEKFASVSKKFEYMSGCTENMLPTKSEPPSTSGDMGHMEKPVLNPNREELISIYPKTEDEYLNDEKSTKSSNIRAGQDPSVQFESIALQWGDSSQNLVEQQNNSQPMDIPSKFVLNEIEKDCDKEMKVPTLYDDIDICEIVAPNISGNESHTANSSSANFGSPANLIISSETNEIPNDVNCEVVKPNVNGDESAIGNAEAEDASCSIAIQLMETDKCANQPKIIETPEMPYDTESAPIWNVETENSPENELNDSIDCTEDRLSSNSTGNLTMDVLNIDPENLSTKEIADDKEIDLESSKPIDGVKLNLVAVGSNSEISQSLKISCNLGSLQDASKIERKEPRFENSKRETENRNKTSLKTLQIKCKEDLPLETTFEHENESKHHAQSENYIAYSPSSEHPENIKGIPKLVIKKTDSLNCKNVCLDQPITLLHESNTGKLTDNGEQNFKGSVHPKIPKILIRNVKSRPSTPSTDEIIEKKVFSVTTKEENKVPKVKIRFDEKRPNSPAISTSENTSRFDTIESKIPKMKIKLEDRLPKMFIKNVNTELSQMNVNVPKIVPKMKIKKLKGDLSQVVDAQVLPVSIPRMFIYTELRNEKQSSLTVSDEKKVSKSNEILKSTVPNSIPCDQKTMKNIDCKKVPKLKIKKQSSGCSIELTRKRHNINPIRSELKKTKKSFEPIDPDDRKHSGRLSASSEHMESPKKDSFSVKASYELVRNPEKTEYTTTVPHSQSAVKSRGDEKNLIVEDSVSGTPEEIPKVIIKRASPSAEFKCELSKGRRDAIIKNRRWQPEVKLQRSWVLDCMAKDLNLDRLRLKLATPGSILKKSLIKKKCDVEAEKVKNDNSTTNRRKNKLFRSKSTSDLEVVHGDIRKINESEVKQLDETNLIDSPMKVTTPKRSKSDLGSSFTCYSKNLQCKKKLKFSSDPSDVQSILRHTLNCSNDFENTSNIQAIEKKDTGVEEPLRVEDSNTGLKNFPESKGTNRITDRVAISKRNPDKTVDENMNSQSGLCISKMNEYNNLLINNETLKKPIVNVDSNLPISSSFTSTAYTSDSKCECFDSTDQIKDILTDSFDVYKTQQVNHSYSHNLPPKREEQSYSQEEVNAAEITGDFKPINSLNEELGLDIGKSSDDNVNRADGTNQVGQNLISHVTVVQQGSNSTRIKDVLNMSNNNNNNLTNSDVKDAQDPKVDSDLNNGLGNTVATEENSVLTYECSEESQPIVEILSVSPIFSGSEIEIQSCLTTNKDNDMCLYHEDAIPTQFELELEITDNVMPDTSEVPTPQNDYGIREFNTSDEQSESSHKSDPIFNNSEDATNLENSESDISSTKQNGTNSFNIRTTTYQKNPLTGTDKQCTILAAGSDNRKSKSTMYIESASELYANMKESFCREDLLIKEVMAAKEMLRKYLTRSKNESEFKLKARPKTAAEKKQGSGFNLSMISTHEGGSKSVHRFVENANRGERPLQCEKKTEFKVNTLKSERKHSKGNMNNSKQKKYSSLPTVMQKYTNVAPIEGYNSISQHSSTDVEDSVALAGDKTTISLKKSKNLIKNPFFSDTRKKAPELINSKDSKFRSKSSRQDDDSKRVGKSKITLSNTTVRELNLNFDHCKEKSVFDAVNLKYKSLIPLSDQNVKSITDKKKFKLYKIPKIIKSTHSETGRSTEGLQETHRSKEVKMPTLEPQVDINYDLEVSEFSVGRETSRSPPVITNPEIVAGHEMTTRTLRNDQCKASSNKEREVLLEQRAIPLEKEVLEVISSYSKETTVADIVNDMAYHEKATIRHRRYCTLCERWFPTVARHRRHLSGYQHRHTELTQRRTIHTLFTLFTGRPCPRLQPPGIVRIDCEPGELTPLQIAVEGVTKESNRVAGNIRTSTSEEK